VVAQEDAVTGGDKARVATAAVALNQATSRIVSAAQSSAPWVDQLVPGSNVAADVASG
jgi:hypothetical protein